MLCENSADQHATSLPGDTEPTSQEPRAGRVRRGACDTVSADVEGPLFPAELTAQDFQSITIKSFIKSMCVCAFHPKNYF